MIGSSDMKLFFDISFNKVSTEAAGQTKNVLAVIEKQSELME
jgi:hypothetical protein